jgi:hypothetical protein
MTGDWVTRPMKTGRNGQDVSARYACRWADTDTDTEFEILLLIIGIWCLYTYADHRCDFIPMIVDIASVPKRTRE